MLFRITELAVAPVIWAVMVWGALQTKLLVASTQHSICGPWGCGPETGALLVIHTLWLAVIGPPMIYVPLRMKLSNKTLSTISRGLFAIGTLGMLSILAWQWLVWLPQAGSWSRDYIWQRCGFAIVTNVDVPLIPIMVLGLILAVIGTIRTKPFLKSLDN